MSAPTGEAPPASAATAEQQTAPPAGAQAAAQQPPVAGAAAGASASVPRPASTTHTVPIAQGQPPPAGVARQPAAVTRDIFNQRSLGKALNSQVKGVRNPPWHAFLLIDDLACPSSLALDATLTQSQRSRDGLLLRPCSAQRSFTCLPSKCFNLMRLPRIPSN